MSEHLGPKAPLRLHMRHAFHDWMWSGGDNDVCGWRRRIARRLPLYFTDPYRDGLPKSLDEFEALNPEPTIGPPTPKQLWIDFTTGKVSEVSPTLGTASSSTWTWKLTS